MTATETARYSVGNVAVNKAPNFAWEVPVPDNDFWRPLRYPSARNFLACFTQPEVDAMKLEQYGSLSNDKKGEILIKLLQAKLAASETPTQPLWTTDNALWIKIMMAIITIHGENNDNLDEQIRISEDMIEKQADKSNLSHQHGLAALLLKRGDYKRAEELERPCLEWLIGRVGVDAPQVMSSRRIIAKAVWMQGRQDEAKALIKELYDSIDASGSGKYAVYQESERKMTEEMVEEVKKAAPAST